MRFGIKLPTGDPYDFLGSGSTDLSIGIASDVDGLFGNAKLGGFYRANISYLGKPDVLADRYNDLVGQFSFRLGYGIHPKANLALQSRLRSAVYESDTDRDERSWF